MENPQEKKPKFDQDEQDTRYIETRQVEINILGTLENLWESFVKGKNAKIPQNYCEEQVESTLKTYFNSWQFFYNEKQKGLNSGGAGEAFTRLTAAGIMEDMPELGKLPYNTSGYGVKVVEKPHKDEDQGQIEVVTDVNPNDPTGCTFKFNCSLRGIEKRTSDARAEIEKKRDELSTREE